MDTIRFAYLKKIVWLWLSLLEFQLQTSVRENKHKHGKYFDVIEIQYFAIMTDINSLENELKEEFEMFSIEITRSDVMDKRKITHLL